MGHRQTRGEEDRQARPGLEMRRGGPPRPDRDWKMRRGGPTARRGPEMAEPVIVCDNVHVRRGAGAASVHVLKGVDLVVEAGESLSLVGPSGSGKSTLLMTIAGLERPQAGRLRVAGEDLAGLSEDALARLRGRAIGIVFQSFHLIPNMTALENVAVPLQLTGAADAFA